MNILIICLGTLSSGEAAIVASCFSNAKSCGVKLHAVTSRLCKPYFDTICESVLLLECEDRLKNIIQFNGYVQSTDPDLFVCADLATMNHAASWSGVSIDEVKKYKIKVAGMDQYSSGDGCQVWDWLGGRPTVVEKNDASHCDLLIRPVPLSRRGTDHANIIHCPLFPGATPASKPLLPRGIGKSKPSKYRIFIANSHWEYNEGSPRMSEPVAKLREWIPEIIYHYICATKLDVEINHIGPQRWKRSQFSDRVEYRHVLQMESSQYQDLLRESDLLITTNVTSITMSSALRYGVPCLLLYNPKPIYFKRLEAILPSLPSWYSEMAGEIGKMGAFRMFPWGWSNFLRNVVEENDYMDLIVQAPIFEPARCVKALVRLLSDAESINQISERSACYFNGVSQMGCLSDKLVAAL